jgi:hypothetical protein
MSRLTPRAIWQIEAMVAERIPKPGPVPPLSPPATL